MEIAIEIKNLYSKQGNFNLYNLQFELPKGYITGIIGRNGAGKTTLIKMISGALKPAAGKILYEGQELCEAEKEIKKKLSVVYDKPNFNQSVNPDKLAQAVASVEPWFDRMYFEEKMKRFDLDLAQQVKGYSEGMKKKFMLILALARRPEILVLDEPTSGVDPVSRKDMLDLVQEFMEDETHTVLFSTHITSDLDHIADFVTMIDFGQIIFLKEKEQLKAEYKTNDVFPSIENIMCMVAHGKQQ